MDPNHRITPAQAAEIVAATQAGTSASALAIQYGITVQSVFYWLKKAGVPGTQTKVSPTQQEEVIKLRKAGESLESICLKTGLKMSSVRWTLAKAKVLLDSASRNKNSSEGHIKACQLELPSRYGVNTWDEVMDQYARDHGGKRIGLYSNSRTSIEWECAIGHRFFHKPSNVSQGIWCGDCDNLSKRLPFTTWQERARAIGIEILVNEHIGNVNTKYPCKCEKGHEFKILLDDIRGGHGCSKCAKNFPLVWEDLVARAAKHGGTCIRMAPTVMEKSLWKCAKEKHPEFLMNANNVQQGQWCPVCSYGNHESSGQKEMHAYILSLAPDAESSTRSVIGPLELDSYVPSKKLGVEYNGLLFHSSYIERFQNQVYNPQKHLKKFLACREAGVSFFGIFEDEWVDPIKKELIKSMIRWRLGLFQGTKLNARDLEVRRLDQNIQFSAHFAAHHIDGHAKASFAYGLFRAGNLVACASVRTNHSGETEIARLATHQDYSVRGGAARLISAIKKEITGPLISYSNNRVGTGEIYETLGFKKLADNPPSYWYTDGVYTRLWRYKCKRDNDPEVIALYPTEKAQALGGHFSRKYLGHSKPLYQIHDYGHAKWVLE